MNNQTFVFQEATNTIRTSPANHLVAHKLEEKGRPYGEWRITTDSAIPEEMALKCFLILRNNHTARWGDGETLLKALTN